MIFQRGASTNLQRGWPEGPHPEPAAGFAAGTGCLLTEALRDFEGTMLFVSHDRAFLRGLSNRVIELGGETGTEAAPHLYPGSYVEYVERTGHEAPGVHA